MAVQYEVLVSRTGGDRSKTFMQAIAENLKKMGYESKTSWFYRGQGKVLWLYGPGALDRINARREQTKLHRHTVVFDMGYICRDAYYRTSITTDHPQGYLDLTPNDPSRWMNFGIDLRSDYDASGPIILVGMGRKTHLIPGISGWEEHTLKNLKERFPSRKIVYRPKPGSTQIVLNLGIEVIPQSVPIQELLCGASLVVCRHSNVAVDAVIAGVPFESQDGAAVWLNGKEYSWQNRYDFLCRLMHWQWHIGELDHCIKFLHTIIERIPKP